MKSTDPVNASRGWMSTGRVVTLNTAAIVVLVVGFASITHDWQANAIKAARKEPPQTAAPLIPADRGTPDDVLKFLTITGGIFHIDSPALRSPPGAATALPTPSAEVTQRRDVVYLELPSLFLQPGWQAWVFDDPTEEAVWETIRFHASMRRYPSLTTKLAVLPWQNVTQAVEAAVTSWEKQRHLTRETPTLSRLVQKLVAAARLDQLQGSNWSKDILPFVEDSMEFLIERSVYYKRGWCEASPRKTEKPSDWRECEDDEALWKDYVLRFNLCEADARTFCALLKTLIRRHVSNYADSIYVSERTYLASSASSKTSKSPMRRLSGGESFHGKRNPSNRGKDRPKSPGRKKPNAQKLLDSDSEIEES